MKTGRKKIVPIRNLKNIYFFSGSEFSILLLQSVHLRNFNRIIIGSFSREVASSRIGAWKQQQKGTLAVRARTD